MDSSYHPRPNPPKYHRNKIVVALVIILALLGLAAWVQYPNIAPVLQPLASLLSGDAGSGFDEQSSALRNNESPNASSETQAQEPKTFTQEPTTSITSRSSSDLAGNNTRTAPAGSASIAKTSAAKQPASDNDSIDRSVPSASNISRAGQTLDQESGLEPEDEVIISGWVLNQNGLPVPAMPISARAYRVFGDENLSAGEQSTVSGDDGFYSLALAVEGEYEIRTAETDRYVSARILVRTGVTSADITVAEKQDFLVYGLVQNTKGEVLSDVKVQPIGASQSTQTDDLGAYAVVVKRQRSGQTPSINFSAEGYRKQHISLRNAQWRSDTEAQLDVTLEPVAAFAAVTGIVSGPGGEAVATARVALSSSLLKQYYQALSDANGSFTMPQVEVGEDYRLWVRAKEVYRDYIEPAIVITESGRDFTIQLDYLDNALLSGFMLDGAGRPVPNFSLWLRSVEASARPPLLVSSDGSGAFTISDVPSGQLKFETRSAPTLSITGLKLDSGSNAFVHLVLDWGDLQLLGKIVDEAGSLTAKPEVTLNWSHQDGELQSRSFRRTTADADGYFLFTNLGPGLHRINVSAEGYRNAHLDVALGVNDPEEVSIQLVRK